MKKLIFPFILIICIVFLTTFSCKNDEPDPQDTIKTIYNEATASDITSGMTVYSEVISLVIINSDSQENKKNSIVECPTFSLLPTTGYPKTLTCDFGTGCTYNDRTVSGSISATLSDRIRNEGTTISVTLTDFKIDTIEVSGTISFSVTEASITKAGVITLTGSITDAELITPSKTITFDSDLTISWELKTLIDYTDDLIKITTFSMNGTNSENKGFTVELEEELVFSADCEEIVSGKVTATTADISFPFSIDFGDGDCDGIATITTTIKLEIGNQTINQTYTYDITLP